jgi:cysteine synthase B
MGESIVPGIFEPSLLDHRLTCPDEEAYTTTRELAVQEGLFCGISSGAALWGAMSVARDLARGSTVVALLPDRGDRYLSTEVFRSVCALCPP